jgi:hypothetical protein
LRGELANGDVDGDGDGDVGVGGDESFHSVLVESAYLDSAKRLSFLDEEADGGFNPCLE